MKTDLDVPRPALFWRIANRAMRGLAHLILFRRRLRRWWLLNMRDTSVSTEVVPDPVTLDDQDTLWPLVIEVTRGYGQPREVLETYHAGFVVRKGKHRPIIAYPEQLKKDARAIVSNQVMTWVQTRRRREEDERNTYWKRTLSIIREQLEQLGVDTDVDAAVTTLCLDFRKRQEGERMFPDTLLDLARKSLRDRYTDWAAVRVLSDGYVHFRSQAIPEMSLEDASALLHGHPIAIEKAVDEVVVAPRVRVRVTNSAGPW